jgi:hypothetical protein
VPRHLLDLVINSTRNRSKDHQNLSLGLDMHNLRLAQVPRVLWTLPVWFHEVLLRGPGNCPLHKLHQGEQNWSQRQNKERTRETEMIQSVWGACFKSLKRSISRSRPYEHGSNSPKEAEGDSPILQLTSFLGQQQQAAAGSSSSSSSRHSASTSSL